MIILITVSSGTTSLISLNINIYGYIYLIYNCRLPVLPRGGPLPGSACRGASAQRCQGRTADTGHRTMTWWLSRTNLWTGTRWAIPVAGGRALASGPRQDLAGQPETGQRGQVATNPPQLHRRERKLSAAHSPTPHALLDDPAHQHLAVHVPETRPPSTTRLPTRGCPPAVQRLMVPEAPQPGEELVDEANPWYLWAPVGACRAWGWREEEEGRERGPVPTSLYLKV